MLLTNVFILFVSLLNYFILFIYLILHWISGQALCLPVSCIYKGRCFFQVFFVFEPLFQVQKDEVNGSWKQTDELIYLLPPYLYILQICTYSSHFLGAMNLYRRLDYLDV